MRTFRNVLTGVVVGSLALAGTLAVAPLPAAAAAPAAPYNVLTLGSYLLDRYMGEPTNGNVVEGADLSVQVSANDHIHLGGTNANGSVTVDMQPGAGVTWAPGFYAPGQHMDSLPMTFQVTQDGITCTPDGGAATLYVIDVARNGVGTVTSLAARFNNMYCPQGSVSGEIRFNSSVAYRVARGSDVSLDFGHQFVGRAGTPKTVTFTSLGSESSVFGNASVDLAGGFDITADSCSGATVAYGQTCSITLTPRPQDPGSYTSRLSLPSSSDVSSPRYVWLSMIGIDSRAVELSPSTLEFGTIDLGGDKTQAFTVQAVGVEPVTVSSTALDGFGGISGVFQIVSDGCAGQTVAPNTSCTITIKARPAQEGDFYARLTVTVDSAVGTLTADLHVRGNIPADGTYVPRGPKRLLDTRSGLGAPKAKVQAHGVVHLQVAGVASVPRTGVAAVVLNVTVTNPTAAGFVSVYPTGKPRPTVSSLNFTAGWTGANLVTVALGQNGQVDLYNNSGSVNLIADIVGFYNGPSTGSAQSLGGAYQPFDAPQRLVDTRKNIGRIPGGSAIYLPVDFGDALNQHVWSFAVNVTVVSPAKAGFFTAWNGADPRPTASTLNYTAGATVSNAAIVPVSWCEVCTGAAHDTRAIAIYTSASAYVVVDIFGFYDDSMVGGGLRFTPLTPVRIADSRIGQGTPRALTTGQTATITPPATVAPPGTAALALNVTAVAPTKATYLTVWAHGGSRPGVSNVNAGAGAVVPNAVTTGILPAGGFDVYNLNGTTNFCVDVVGTFYYYAYWRTTNLRAPDAPPPAVKLPAAQPAPVVRPFA